jgi:ABC-2 type transport system permease protein
MAAELRAAAAIARKDLRILARYAVAFAAHVFSPLYQSIIPAFLFGAAFAVGGRQVGMEASLGTADLAGFLFMGGVVSGLVSTSFWGVGFSLRTEMDAGHLEPTWLTPTRRTTLVLGRGLSGLVVFLFVQAALFAIGIAFFGLRVRPEALMALPAVILACAGMIGVSLLVAAAVLLVREANFLVDTTSFLFGVASGTAFPVTLLPGLLQPVAFLLPTTYAVDILRYHAIGSRTYANLLLEYAALLVTVAVVVALGIRAFSWADHVVRVRGTIAQH